MEYVKVTNETLRDLGAENIPMIYVFNKADLTELQNLPVVKEDKIYMSAKQGIGLSELLTMISGKLAGGYAECEMLLPYSRGDIVSYLNENAVIHETEYLPEGVSLKVNMRRSDYGKYEEFVKKAAYLMNE